MNGRSVWALLNLTLLLGLGHSTAAAVEESAILAWAPAGGEIGGVLACTETVALLGAPGLAGPNDRFFLGAFDPQTGLWTNLDEVIGSGLTDLSISPTRAAAVINDTVETYGWATTGLNPAEIITGSSPRAVAIGNTPLTEVLAVGRHAGAFPIYAGVVTTYAKDGAWVFEDSFQEEITYGWALSINRNEVLIGQQGSSVATGTVSFIERTTSEPFTWTGVGPFLSAPDAELNNSFGVAVSFDGDRFAVGAPLDDNAGGTDAGAVHLYRRACNAGSGWSEDGILVSPNPVAGGRFGADVSLRGRDLVVGEPGAGDPITPDTGAAHLFRRGSAGWEYVETMTRFDQTTGDAVGEQVCIGEYGVLVGGPMIDRTGTDSGAVLFYYGLNTLFADGFECGLPGGWSIWNVGP